MRIVFLYIIIPLVILLVILYFWGSSGTLTSNELHEEIVLDEGQLSSGDTFSIMTYNLGYLSGMTNNLPVKPPSDLFQDNLQKIQDLLQKQTPDIIGFQEIDFASNRSYELNQLEALSSGYRTAIKSVNWDKKYVPFPYWPPSVHFGRMTSGQALLSKFPVTESQRIVLPRPSKAPFYYQAFYLDRLIQLAEININGSVVVLLNVHLEAFDTETRESQGQIVLDVLEQYINDKPLFLIGDFNARPPFAKEQVTTEETIKLFMDHPLLSPALEMEDYIKNEADHFTFDTSNPIEKLDYIFYSHNSIQKLNVSILNEAGEISDHFPLLMTFTLIDQ